MIDGSCVVFAGNITSLKPLEINKVAIHIYVELVGSKIKMAFNDGVSALRHRRLLVSRLLALVDLITQGQRHAL